MDDVAAARLVGPTAAGEGERGTPRLELEVFSGPLALLLSLARTREIDLARLSVVDLVDQLALALEQADPIIPLSQKAGWVVMVSWLLLLRSRLALPPEAPAQQDAADDAEALRGQLIELRAAQALAHWLDRRPRLGRDVFARGQPEVLGTSIDTRYEVDVVEFLWACLEQFEDDTAGDGTDTVYQPWRPDLCSVLEARARMERLLAEMLETAPFARFLPKVPGRGRIPRDIPLWRRSAVASTFMAGLELRAKRYCCWNSRNRSL
jgi:segregation and condensation protein A